MVHRHTGSWSQVIQRKLRGHGCASIIVAVDVQPMRPLHGFQSHSFPRVLCVCCFPHQRKRLTSRTRRVGVIQVRGDITQRETLERIRRILASAGSCSPPCLLIKQRLENAHVAGRGSKCEVQCGAGGIGNAHVIVCDGAPDVTGLHDLDAHLSRELVAAALGTSICWCFGVAGVQLAAPPPVFCCVVWHAGLITLVMTLFVHAHNCANATM